jgi:hypothetical protein
MRPDSASEHRNRRKRQAHLGAERKRRIKGVGRSKPVGGDRTVEDASSRAESTSCGPGRIDGHAYPRLPLRSVGFRENAWVIS